MRKNRVSNPLRRFIPCYLFLLEALLLQAFQGGWGAHDGPISRAEIQHFFISGEGNSVRTGGWLKNYYHQEVAWSGKIYAIHRRPESLRVEILIKVLPESILYDTVAILEGNTTLDPILQKGQWVSFRGRIFDGVDAMGVKEVQVLMPTPDSLRPLGEMPVNNTTFPPLSP